LSYPDLRVTVDMRGDYEILKAFWTVVREKLFDLIINSGLKKGHLNLDNDVSVFQLRDGVMKKANDLRNLELFDCEISGTLIECNLYRCKINSSRFDKCKLLDANEVMNSKVEHTTVMPHNTLVNCYINNPSETIEGRIEGGVIRKGIIGKNSYISKETLIVDAQGESKGTGKKDFESLSNAFSKKQDDK
jgi:hypothetical protein